MATARPPLATLRLTNPRMGADDSRGPLIRTVQRNLRGYGITEDGVYGPRTAWAVAVWQERSGAPNTGGAVTPAELLVLLGHRRVPADWVQRRRDPGRRAEARAAQAGLARLADAERPIGRLTVIPRDTWCTVPRGPVSRVVWQPGVPHVVHWFGPGVAADGYDAGVRQVNGFAAYHRYRLRWTDLAYSYAVLRDERPGTGLATVLEGRGRNVRGAHSGHNQANTYPGVLVVCGTGTPTATDPQLRSLQALREQELWGRRTGHLEWSPTACPGPHLWPWVQAHR